MAEQLEGGFVPRWRNMLMPVTLIFLIFPTWEVRVLSDGDHSGRVDKMGLGDRTHSPLCSGAVPEDERSQHLLLPLPPELSWIVNSFATKSRLEGCCSSPG